MTDVRRAIANWFRVVRRGGYLIIYGPERDLYEKRRTLPSRFNPHHQHMFLVGRKEAPDTLDICEEIRAALSTTGGALSHRVHKNLQRRMGTSDTGSTEPWRILV